MSVLVTGAAGFIGSHVADRLLARGESVVGLDNFDAFYPEELKHANLREARDHASFREVHGDIREPELLRRLPDDIDAVVHLAARAGVRPSIADPLLYADVNIRGTLELLALARTRGIRTFLFASSSSVYGENDRVPFSEEDRVDHPVSPYAATKKAGELLCHAAAHLDGLSCLCLRLFTVYGPRQRPDLAIRKFAERMAAGAEIPVFGDGSTARDYTYVDDIVTGITSALDLARGRERGYEIVNLGGSRAIPLEVMIRTLAEALDVEPRIHRLPLQPGDVTRTFADIGKARRLLGYEPATDFRTGIHRFVAWFREGAGRERAL